MLSRALKVRVGDVVSYETNVYVVKRIFSDGTFVLRGIKQQFSDMCIYSTKYIDSKAKFDGLIFLQI